MAYVDGLVEMEEHEFRTNKLMEIQGVWQSLAQNGLGAGSGRKEERSCMIREPP